MDLLKRTFEQFRDLFQGLAPSQRFTLLVVPLLVLGGLGTLMYVNSTGGTETLLGGKFFSPQELAQAQEAFRLAGLSEFQVEGQRIAVPRGEAEKYTAALVVSTSLPADFAADFDRMQKNIGLFTPESQRQEMLEENKKLRLSKILRAIPGIEDAAVEWDRPKRSGFARNQTVPTAQVSVKTRGGEELSAQLVTSLRLFVSGAVAGITPERVTVLDVNTGKAFAPAAAVGDPLNDPIISLTRLRTADYEQKIQKALAYIPGVIVTVNVDLDTLRSHIEREQEIDPKPFTLQSNVQTTTQQSTDRPSRAEPGANSNQPRSLQQHGGNEKSDTVEQSREENKFAASFRNIEKTFEGLFPKSVQVAVSIPDDFYRQVAIQRGAAEGTTDEEKRKFQTGLDQIRQNVEKDVSSQVAKLIPLGSPIDAVSVKSHPSVEQKVAPSQISYFDTVSDLVNQWGGPAALLLFTLWALRMFQRNLARLPAESSATALAQQAEEEAVEEQKKKQQQVPQGPTRRDEVQTLVRDNPEMAAAVLSKWIAPRT